MNALRAEVLIALVLLGEIPAASAQDFICLGAAQDSTQNAGPSPNVIGKVVFVHAPGRPDNYPYWYVELCQQLSSFLSYESRGLYQLTLTPLYRPDDSSKTWELPRSAGDYRNGCAPGVLCYGDANKDIMLAAHNEWLEEGTPSVWSGVQKVIVIYESGSCVFTGSCPSGRGDLGFFSGSGIVPGFTGNGATLGMAAGELDQPTLNYRFLGGVAHEFGHTLLFQDVVGSGSCGSPPTNAIGNVGRYDLMRSPGDGQPADNGVPSYHPSSLTGWVPLVSITSAAGNQTLRIPIIRDPVRGAIYQVGAGSQYFLLANYDPLAFGPWDAVYLGDGLLIWHLWYSPDGLVTDLESAEGKWTSGVADPVNGKDPLEADWCFRGSGRDFFGRRPLPPPLNLGKPQDDVPRDFTGDTNPNTNFYGASYLSQPFCSDVEFRNIRRDTNGDMLVDVSWLTQPLLSPNGGEFFVRGQVVPVQWAVSATRQTCIQSVSVALWTPPFHVTLAQGLPNTGSASVTIPATQPFSTFCFVRVVTELGGPPIVDASDTPITIWGIDEASVAPIVTTFCQDTNGFIGLDVSWQTSVATDAFVDKLELYSQAGALLGTSTGGTGGTSHRRILKKACQTGWYYYHVKSKKGIGETVSSDRSFQITACPSCPPCGPEGCQLQ